MYFPLWLFDDVGVINALVGATLSLDIQERLHQAR
jgi:hypothetical protein